MKYIKHVQDKILGRCHIFAEYKICTLFQLCVTKTVLTHAPKARREFYKPFNFILRQMKENFSLKLWPDEIKFQFWKNGINTISVANLFSIEIYRGKLVDWFIHPH